MAHGPTPDERPSQKVRQTKRYRLELRALGLKVRYPREQHSWTQEAAAEEMGLDVTHLNKIERGAVNVTFGTIVRMADALDVNLVDLFSSRPASKR
jgi:transcriptional regulator with XRE-family HTH domain